AVGHFTVHASLEHKNLTAQDAGILKVTVKGNGNLPVVTAPNVQWPDGIETFDPTTKEEIDKTVYPLSGSKTFEYNFVPKKAGNYTIPAIQLAYFDPASSSYKTVEAKSMDVAVAPAKNNKSGTSQALLASSDGGNSFIDF